jgi:hypothetical protein
MSGPFTWDELKKEARGNVIVSPLGTVDKAGEPGKLRITCNLSFKGNAPFSVNDRIDKDAFSTKWGTAATIIDLVSPFIPIFTLSILRPLWHLPMSISSTGDVPKRS